MLANLYLSVEANDSACISFSVHYGCLKSALAYGGRYVAVWRWGCICVKSYEITEPILDKDLVFWGSLSLSLSLSLSRASSLLVSVDNFQTKNPPLLAINHSLFGYLFCPFY